jgi:hypothetical protein
MAASRRTALLGVAFLAFCLQTPSIATAQDAHTLKERLSDKASDNQRVNNCHVPPERRGPVPRSDCPEEPHSSAPAVEPGADAPKSTAAPE